MNNFIYEDTSCSHSTPDTHACAKQLLTSTLQLCETRHDLTNTSFELVSSWTTEVAIDVLIPRGCEMAIEPPLWMARSMKSCRKAAKDLLWIDFLDRYVQFLYTICELWRESLIDLCNMMSFLSMPGAFPRTSYTSMSSFESPTCCRSFGIAKMGEIPMYLGSTPKTSCWERFCGRKHTNR